MGLKRWIAGIAAAVLAGAGIAIVPAANAADANLMNNGGFETGTTSGWNCAATATVVSTPVHGGTHALSVAPTVGDTGQCAQTVSVQPNSAYTLSAWVQGSFVFIGATGTGTSDASTFTQSAPTYSQLSVGFKTGASTTSVTIFLHGWYGQPAYFADDVALTGPGGTTTVPGAPTGLTVAGTTASTAALSWTAPSGTVSSYNIFRNGAKVGTSTSTSFTDTGLAASTAFTYTVSAVNSAGESAQSAPVTATTTGGGPTVPAPPTGLTVTGTSSSSVSLSWTAPSGTVASYNVFRNGTKVGSSTTTSFTDTGLAASTTFTYTVSAVNGAGESAQSASVMGTTAAGGPTVPGAPSGLSVTGTTSSTVSLSWTAASGTVTGYNVFRNGAKVGTSTTTSFTDTGLAASTSFTYAVSAFNSAGESAKSGSVSATTSGTGGNGGPLPAHVLTGYWQDFTNQAKPLRLSDVPTTYDLVAVAFANTDPAKVGGVTFAVDPDLSKALGGYTDADFISDIATLHSRGEKVIISVGGQNGTVSVGDSTAAANFASSVTGLMNKYGFDGVDIDLENGVSVGPMSQALHSIAASHPGAIITLAPQTIDMQSTGMAYFQLALAIKDVLTIVNTQYYNSGSMNGCNNAPQPFGEGNEDFLTALACIQLMGGLRPDQVGLGLPAVPAGAPSGGFVPPSTVNAAMDCLDMGTNCGNFKPPSTWPGLRGAMTWSINWDATNGFNFANTVHPHLSVLK